MPQVEAPRVQIIDAYGNGGFRVSGEIHRGSIIVLSDRVLPWLVTDMAGLTAESLQPIIASGAAVEIVLLGCGPRFAMVPEALRRAVSAAGMSLDAMDTGAACRTYNVLRAEERRVAAALIAVG